MIYYLIILNIISFIIYGIDKLKAKRKYRRIKEKTLITLSLIGGPLGSIMGMYIFRHKTKKLKFKILNLLSLILWIIIIVKL